MKIREIKFRFWHTSRKKMIDENYSGGWRMWHWIKNEVKCVIPMQFTGMEDKNGVEIYEGDIVIHPNSNQTNVDKTDKKYIVEFTRGAFVVRNISMPSRWRLFASQRKYNQQKSIEVIGNIFENNENY